MRYRLTACSLRESLYSVTITKARVQITLLDLEQIRTAISLVAIIVSLASLYFARKSWERTNRPLVTAFIEENGEGPAFDFKVANTGNRPALNVGFKADQGALDAMLESSAQEEHKRAVYECFALESYIPVLRNGEALATALGFYNEKQPWLNYGATTTIEVTYSDLEGKRYCSKIPLKVFSRNGFGGSVWRKSNLKLV